ncbi:MAG TPA: TetR/AcrR family transcriptional regulator, partial [Saprospiraceae bacterium]|nr:TetR/AcrR family transcriptional regulator [Saprospiraceae bacterium]
MTKKEKITQTALQLIVNQGIQETPMSQISKVSGVAMGTIYHHFKSKNEIINQIYLDVKKEFGASIMKDVDKKMEYKARFYQIWKNIFNFFYQHELMFRFSQHFGHLPIITETTRQEGLVFYEPVIDFLAEGIQL